MKRNIFRLFAIIAIAGLAFTGCQKEAAELVPQENQAEFLTADKTEEIKLEETAFSSKKSSFTVKQVFLDGGTVIFSNWTAASTTIVGNQRWTTINYSGQIPNVTPFYEGGAYQYPYDAAMTLNGLTSAMNTKTGIIENSTWRIPTWDDMNHLHHMVHGDEASIVAGLNMQATGMFKWDGVNASVHQNPDYGIFWNSDFSLGTQGQDTWHLFANDSQTHVFGFQYQIEYPYAPIRLVQDIEPIQ